MAKDMAEIEGRRYLNAWAREQGYSDYDTYLAVGGRVSETANSLSAQMKRIGYALSVLYRAGQPEPFEPPVDVAEKPIELPPVAEEDVDAPDASNAHVQGA